MSNFAEKTFRRKFSINPYRQWRLPMGEMSLCRDWVHDDRGNPYPLLESSGTVRETVSDGRYRAEPEQGSLSRLLGQFFPYATYELQTPSPAIRQRGSRCTEKITGSRCAGWPDGCAALWTGRQKRSLVRCRNGSRWP